MDDSKLRAWYSHRQGLDGSMLGKSAAEILGRTGWARSVGGSGPYLTLFARGGLGREEIDAAVADLTIHELPSARGCTYVLPASDFALGLKLSQDFQGEQKVAEKLGVRPKEIDNLCAAVLGALEKGPLDPDGLKQATGKGAVRNLGREGQKKGLSTTLPVALEKLQSSGEIRRIPTNGRLDQQRYKYALWRRNPLSGFSLSAEESRVELARRFFSWIGPATLAEFQWISGLGVKAAKQAVESLELAPLGKDDQRLLFASDLEKLDAFRRPREPQYCLVSSIDALFLLRRNLKDLIDPKDLSHEVFTGEDSKPLGGLPDLPSAAIVDRGRIVGLWEYDPAGESIAWTAFIKKDAALVDAVTRTERYIREQLGDARSFSLDTPKSRATRLDSLRKSAAR